MKQLLRLSPVALLCACSMGGVFEDAPPTLADLQPAALPQQRTAPPRVSLEELADIYRDVLEQQEDPNTRLQVSHRLADLDMLAAEERLASATETSQDDFAAAIVRYETLLAEQPDYDRQDQVLYQLSKAYALVGRDAESMATLSRLEAAAPGSGYLPEAYFRLAERAFVDANYSEAETLYSQVIGYGSDTTFFTRSLYMQGWSRFKQDEHRGAIESFVASLDELLPEPSSEDSLARADQELVQDSLRVLAIVFSRLQGTDTIPTAMETQGPRHYDYLLYESLGTLYLSQERFDDSAQTYQAYIAHHPDSQRAHRFQLRVIEAYTAGGFADLVVSAKQEYVQRFATTGDYWLGSSDEMRATMATQLQQFIPELARHYHALAQAEQKRAKKASKRQQQKAQPYYAQAAHYYQQYLDSFPEDPQVPELTFLLAESQYEAQNFSAAISAYERVAYDFGEAATTNAADAGYMAILAHEALTNASDDDTTELMRARIDSELRFQDTFSNDPRAPRVLGHAAGELLALKDYDAALGAATTLAKLTPQPEQALLTPAWLVIGHSQFALDNYAAAEAAYDHCLTILPKKDARRGATIERLAAAIYRQGELAADNGLEIEAAGHYQRAAATAPQSDIAVSARYDAAQALQRAGELQQANTLLTDFRRRYPKHELSNGIGATLLANYEQLGQWQQAAEELDTLRADSKAAEADPDFPRQAHFMAASYYEKAGDNAMAIDRYRSYAHTWSQPVGDNMEAMDKLVTLYGQSNERDKQRFWLKKTMATHDKAGSAQSDRSRYLAATAAASLAQDSYDSFTSLKLAHPVKTSLPPKQRAMQQAIDGYGRCTGYAVEQVMTQCSFRLASVYQLFSADLMDSERPQGLDALALEQYEIMLEEQAYPFEEKAIAIHESNALRVREGVYDQWVQDSFTALGDLLPARYGKPEAATLADIPKLEDSSVQPPSRKVKDLNDKAIGLREAGDFDGAEQAYMSALAISESDALTHHNIGILYDLYLGEPQGALYHYDRYQAITGGSDRRVAGWLADLERRQVQIAGENE